MDTRPKDLVLSHHALVLSILIVPNLGFGLDLDWATRWSQPGGLIGESVGASGNEYAVDALLHNIGC